MNRTIIWQSPASLYEVVPIFYRELKRLNYFDRYYLATDHPHPTGLGEDVTVIKLDRDYGWEGNLTRLLAQVPEDIFVMMCDDHVVVPQIRLDLDRYFWLVKRENRLGRLQLSPPSRNYARFLIAHGQPVVIPDDSRAWYPYDRRYRFHLNFQPSIWRREYLSEAIKGGGNRSQLEIRASERARSITKFVSGYIGQHAVRYENFFASCQVHHTDPNFHRQQRAPHYREEFVRYALEHGIKLDPGKRVQVRNKLVSASVPVGYYLKHYRQPEAFKRYVIRKGFWAQKYWQWQKRVRALVAPYTSWSSR